eukprot:m.56813 g.56813  ORF g.56813 m.56813 type:complete len:416 (+) comp22299_c0_seq1:251-1498(+)
MIQSVYILSSSGDILVEKHYRNTISKSVLDPWLEEHHKCATPDQMSPICRSGNFTLINILRENLFMIAVVPRDVSPLFVIEFLHRAMDIFVDYFGQMGEAAVNKYTLTVYQLLEEMLDNGFPLATELNVLKEMIRPPTWTAVFDSVTGSKGVREKLPTGVTTNTQWRKASVKYSSNECFVDIVEHIDCICDKNGGVIFNEIRGEINCRVKLSGMPDLNLTFINPRILEDVSFHPCVRLQQWQGSHAMSFVPPDGAFNLAKYILGPETQILVPLQVRPVITFSETGGKIDIEISSKQCGGKLIEDLVITMIFPKCVNSVNGTPSVGTQSFDQVDRAVRWEIKRLPTDKPSTLKGSISTVPGSDKPDAQPTITCEFKVPGFAASGLKVNRLDITGEKYKPFKGVKYTTCAGRYEIRS